MRAVCATLILMGLSFSLLTGCAVTREKRVVGTPSGPVEESSVSVKPTLGVKYEERDYTPSADD